MGKRGIEKGYRERSEIAELTAIVPDGGQQVMIDSDLAGLYGVPTRRLNERVKRNLVRFPDDFMFQLTPEETENLRSQTATSSSVHGGRRYLPYVCVLSLSTFSTWGCM